MSVLQEIKVFKEIANEDRSTVAKVYFKTGDRVSKGDAVAELSTSKAVFVVEVEKDGYIEYLCKEGEDAAVGAVIIRIHDNMKDAGKDKKKAQKAGAAADTQFSSSALKLMEKKGLDKSVFTGRDFVSADDVRNFIGLKSGKIDKAKELEIESLRDVQSANLNCTVAVYVDTARILEFAGGYLKIFTDSVLPFVIFETARLLKKYPLLNAFYSDGGIVYHDDVMIGLAIDIDYGLKVVNLPGAETKSVKEIESDIFNAANRYIDRKLVAGDVSGATFTITDMSKEGVAFFTPLIGKRQSAILGISAIDDRLNRVTLTLTFDHRVTDGRHTAKFLADLKARLESYALPLLRPLSPAHQVSGDKKCYKCMATLDDIRKNGGTGLLKMVDRDGNEKLVCELCILGWE